MKLKEKKQKKVIRRFLCELLANMTLIDRIRFALTGSYLKPLERTTRKFPLGDFQIVRGASDKPRGGSPEVKR